MNISYEALTTIVASLSPERRATIQSITEMLLRLRLSQGSTDAIIASIILEAAEVQFTEDGGTVPPVRESTLDILRPIFESKKTKSKKN
jgi:hypothetical protein